MLAKVQNLSKFLTPEKVFIISAIFVNGGNYAYNLILGRILGPQQFADAAILVTLLLVVSFVAMTFQLVVAKGMAEHTDRNVSAFIKKAYRYALGFGIFVGALVVVFSKLLKDIFNTQSHSMFIIFGLAIPFYFLMSVNRGKLQGVKSFTKLAATYQLEMISRFIITLVLLFFFDIDSSLAVSIAIAISFIAGIFPLQKKSFHIKSQLSISNVEQKLLIKFFIVTACYELTQIICNNSDILLVKHFFPSYDAGLYASLALIGRVVYFVTWMFVMLLLPTVIAKRKEGENTVPVLLKYVTYISILAGGIVVFTFLFPTFSVTMLFGEDYIAIAPLLGWYALATSFFAISNVFAYYFLSLDKYIPIIIASILGIAQIILITLFHENLYQVVIMQVIAMCALLIGQLGYFFIGNIKTEKLLNRKLTSTHRYKNAA